MSPRRVPVVLAVLAVLLLASGASAAVLEGGPEFRVNVSTQGEQYNPSLAVDAAGNTMVVWQSDHEQAQATPLLYGRIYDASGAPRTGEFRIAGPGASYETGGRVVADPAGGFLVLWSQGSGGLFGRRFSAGGEPVGDAFVLLTFAGYPKIAARPAGGFFLVWTDGFGLHGAVLDSTGALGPARTFQAGPLVSEPSVTVAPGGDILVTWSVRSFGLFSEDVWARLLDPAGRPQGGAFPVNGEAPYQAGYQHGSAGVFHPDGSFSIVWQTIVLSTNGGVPGLFGRTFAASGESQAGVVRLDGGALPEHSSPAVASDPFGRILVLWSGSSPEDEAGVFARFFGPALQPLGVPFLANLFKDEEQFQPVVAADAHGGFTAVWSSGSGYPVFIPRGDEGENSQDGSFFGVFGRRFAGCVPGAGQLCLASGRFRVEVAWTDHDGNSGTGHAVPLTDDTGSFWFFHESNLELMIKVLDGRGVNGHFWVFYGALSDVRYTITVTDTVTEAVETYTNPSGRLASHADTEAFADPTPPPAALAAAPARLPLPLTPPLLNCGIAPGSPELCLGERFLVSVRFVDPRTGTAEQGQPFPLTRDTGAFSFFDGDNLELMIKALDGVPVNGRYWIFYGALSNVEYTITVKDVFTDETRTYRNPAGTMASRADTSAFPLP